MKYITLGFILFLFISSNNKYSFDTHELKIELIKRNVQHWDIVYKQAILETGWFKSKVFKENNNLFGFWYKGKYLKFDSWQQSVQYYKEWQYRKYVKRGLNNYYKFLKELPYAEDPNYIVKLKNIKIKD